MSLLQKGKEGYPKEEKVNIIRVCSEKTQNTNNQR